MVRRDKNLAKQTAKEHNISKFYTDIDELGKDNAVDAVYIATPNTTHAELTLKALRQDVHVFCEKPFATSLEEANKIIEAAKKSKAIYQGGHNRLLLPFTVLSRIKSRKDSLSFYLTLK